MNPSSPVIDLDAEVRAYGERLHTVLRGFQTGLAFLDSWVPDADPVESALSMFESARAAGLPALAVRLGAEGVDLGRLQAEGARMGALRVETAPGALTVHLEFGESAGPGGPAGRVPRHEAGGAARAAVGSAASGARDERAAYAPGLARWGASRRHAGELPVGPGEIAVQAAVDGAVLDVAVNEAGVVRIARHHGAAGDEAALLEALCATIEGEPLREVLDHAVKRVELGLREDRFARVVPGIQHPEAVSPLFGLATRLVRGLRAPYLAAGRTLSTESRWVPPPGASWMGLDAGERVRRLQAAVDAAGPALGYAPGDIEVVEVERDVRVIVAFTVALHPSAKRERLLRLEPELKRSVDPSLVVYLEEAPDKNRLRRL